MVNSLIITDINFLNKNMHWKNTSRAVFSAAREELGTLSQARVEVTFLDVDQDSLETTNVWLFT
jgi:hypothetical protein